MSNVNWALEDIVLSYVVTLTRPQKYQVTLTRRQGNNRRRYLSGRVSGE